MYIYKKQKCLGFNFGVDKNSNLVKRFVIKIWMCFHQFRRALLQWILNKGLELKTVKMSLYWQHTQASTHVALVV